MKKKAIERIPYLTLPKVSRKKMVEYIGVTAFKIVDHEQHLFLELYRNDKACKNIPVVRIVLNKKDYGTYFTKSGAWSQSRITSNTWDSNGLIWREDEDHEWRSREDKEKENVLYSQKDLERIKAFTNETVWREERWWDFIDQWQKDISSEKYRKKERRKYERRQQALKEREEQTPELPEERIAEYADKIIFKDIHYLYYKKHGVRATVACTKCGGVSEERWKPGISYESRFEKLIQEPRMGDFGTCPMCGARGKYMPQGRVKSFYRQEDHVFLGQRYKEDGMVFRYIDVEKEWHLGLICGEKEPEMYNAHEIISGVEIARVYFEPGKKIQKDYHKHNPWSGDDFWDDCNLYGNANITVREAQIMPETFHNMKGTFLQYSALEEFQEAAGVINPVDYLERYIQTPQIEMLVKMDLIHVVKELIKCHYGIVYDVDANRVEAFLGIRKERVKQLIDSQGDIDILDVMQMEKLTGQNWTGEQIEQLAEIDIDRDQIELAMEHMTVQKLLNRISKYAGCGYGTMCSTAMGRLRQTKQTYFDYLTMRKALGYDINNTVYLFPRDLNAAHAVMIHEFNKKEADKRLMEVAVKYPLIKKHYRRLRKRFYYEDGNFLIRPARNAEEIVMEGRILHHCVGGDTYLEKHNQETSIILFLRTAKEPEVPYITVEIDPKNLHILQWYGAHDKKPDQKNMDRWLNAYITRLKCQSDGTLKEATAEAAMPVLAYA